MCARYSSRRRETKNIPRLRAESYGMLAPPPLCVLLSLSRNKRKKGKRGVPKQFRQSSSWVEARRYFVRRGLRRSRTENAKFFSRSLGNPLRRGYDSTERNRRSSVRRKKAKRYVLRPSEKKIFEKTKRRYGGGGGGNEHGDIRRKI